MRVKRYDGCAIVENGTATEVAESLSNRVRS